MADDNRTLCPGCRRPADCSLDFWSPTLGTGCVDVWVLLLPDHLGALTERQALLAPDELERASRYLVPSHRNRFVATRGALRMILSRAMGIPPRDIGFSYGAHGKPRLARERGVFFNVSHSEDMAVIALTDVGELGVDIECVRHIGNLERLTQRFFSEGEHARIVSMPPPERLAAFFRYWTCKEAYMKGVGTGLSCGLDRFEVILESHRARVVVPGAANEAGWTLSLTSPAADYFMAVALNGPAATIRYHH